MSVLMRSFGWRPTSYRESSVPGGLVTGSIMGRSTAWWVWCCVPAYLLSDSVGSGQCSAVSGVYLLLLWYNCVCVCTVVLMCMCFSGGREGTAPGIQQRAGLWCHRGRGQGSNTIHLMFQSYESLECFNSTLSILSPSPALSFLSFVSTSFSPHHLSLSLQVRSTSHKPDEIYGMIERLSPGTRKIELFGRPHNVQPNWYVCVVCVHWICKWGMWVFFHFLSVLFFSLRVTLGNQLDGIHLLDPDVVARFKKRYPDGVISKPKNM